jgi:DNA repair protein RadC
LAVITGVPCLETTQRLLIAAGGLRGLLAISTTELQQLVAGISVGRAAQLKAAIELGRRVACGDQTQRRQIKSPNDIANLLLLEMSHLDQEQLRTVLLDTKIVFRPSARSISARSTPQWCALARCSKRLFVGIARH